MLFENNEDKITWQNEAIDSFFQGLDESNFNQENIEETIHKLAHEIINILK